MYDTKAILRSALAVQSAHLAGSSLNLIHDKRMDSVKKQIQQRKSKGKKDNLVKTAVRTITGIGLLRRQAGLIESM